MDEYEHGLIFNSMGTMFPWFSKLISNDRALLGQDWWPYGIQANRSALDAIFVITSGKVLQNAASRLRISSCPSC